MKLKTLSIAALSFCAFSSFAASVDATKCSLPASAATTTAADLVAMTNNCAPEVTLFIAGSSALGGSVNSTVLKYFKTGYIAQIVDTGTPNGPSIPNKTNNGQPGNGEVAFYGIAKDGIGLDGKRLLVVYNSYMGSAAGVSNLMAGDKLLVNVPEADVVTVGPVTTGKGSKAVTSANICGTTSLVAAASTTDVKAVVACPSHGVTRADIALSDVRADELVGMYDVLKGGPSITAIKSVPFAMQGFGIAVNNKLYIRMQELQGLKTSSSCGLDSSGKPDYTAACQPNISKATYASLVATEGGIKTAADLLNVWNTTGTAITDATKLVIARRDELSGTQATSNIFFGNGVCNVLDTSAKVNKHGGASTILTSTTPNIDSAKLVVQSNVQTSDVETSLANTTDYVIGVLALSKMSSTAYSFVKLDNVSPYVHSTTATTSGTTTIPVGSRVHSNDNSRAKMISGEWPLQVVSYAMYLKTAVAAGATKKTLIEGIVSDLKDPTGNLKGLGYFSGDSSKQTMVSRPGGNNCAPLLFKGNTEFVSTN
jgi:hypothetical protein